MPNRDFIDADLLKPRGDTGSVRLGAAAEAGAARTDAAEDGGRSADLELSQLARHKKLIEEEAALKAQEIELLRQRQESLEREKRELEETRRKQSDYERGKQEMLERLQQSLVAIERHELRAAQLTDLLQNLRRRFKEMEGQIRDIREDDWPEEGVREELTKALALIDDARMEYNRSMAKLDALLGDQSKGGAAPAVVFEGASARAPAERTFGQWVALGFAVSLPILLMLALLALLFALQSAGLLF